MSETKYKTFRDLRTVKRDVAQEAPLTSSSISSRPSIPSTSRSSSRPSTSIAPERDFQRVPNSITRAMPLGLFRGKSKQVYDYLYSVTRGAIVPTRKARKSRKEIKEKSGLGSMVTVDAAIGHLESVGLISISPAIGSLIGNEYEVFTPDEAFTRTPSISSTSSPTQNLVQLDEPQSSTSSTTQAVETNTSSESTKTSLKTNTIDDDALRKLREAERELTGKQSSSEAWDELFDLLASELKTAAARTKSVSSAPAFLTAHLKRRLGKAEKQKPTVVSVDAPHVPIMIQHDRRLTPEEITEQTQIIADLLEGGYSIEQAELQFRGSFHPDDWRQIATTLGTQNFSEGK